MCQGSNYGSTLLSATHWYVATKILEFLGFFYESTVVFSGVYYPSSPLVLHHLLEIVTQLHESENGRNLFYVVYHMKLNYFKYQKDIPKLYSSFAFILDPEVK